VLTIQRTNVAAGAVAVPLSGSQVEVLPMNAQVEIAILCTAVGIVASVTSGTDILMEEGPVFVKAAGVPPAYPDDFTLSDVAAQGERLSIRLRNTTAGALDVITAVKTTAL